MVVMRFVLIFGLFVSFPVWANVPMPHKKPITDQNVRTEDVVYRLPAKKPDLIEWNTSIQEETPVIKAVQMRKPLRGITVQSPQTFDNIIASRADIKPTQAKTHALRPKRILEETRMASPFPQKYIPKAVKETHGEPVILFFVDDTATLETGQMMILKNEVLKPLTQSRYKTVSIYAYADKTKEKSALDIAEERAAIIRDYLLDNRIVKERMTVTTLGDQTNIRPRERVEVIIQ